LAMIQRDRATTLCNEKGKYIAYKGVVVVAIASGALNVLYAISRVVKGAIADG
jgi:hypothetical protein